MTTAVTLALGAGASAATLTVLGTDDPWLAAVAAGGSDGGDVAPAESPAFAGSVTPGSSVSWTASGLVSNDPGLSVWPLYGPDGNPGNLVLNGGKNVNSISGLDAPLDALIGVFTGPGGGTLFLMGSSGTETVPAGATGLYLGVMDGFNWANNVGSFTVNLAGVPDGGLTVAMLGMAVSGLAFLRRKL